MPTKNSPVRIVVDAMGGDHAPEVNIQGTLSALKENPDLHVILVGDKSVLTSELAGKKGIPGTRLTILHADEVITMEDHAASVVRKKKNSSIHIGMQEVKEGRADAFISAGNSGAVMAVALHVLGRLPDVERPAIIVKLPTAEDFIILLDAGANVDCRPSHLFQFAAMGQVYASTIEKKEKVRVALLANGEEMHKGNELTRETDLLLRESKFPNYVGYVEGYDLFKDKADVIVCDGFVGNVTLKVAEGLASASFQWFRKAIQKDIAGMLGLMFMRTLMKKFRDKFDYQPYGAAPLLGIDGMVLISHGSSTSIAIQNGILTAKRGVDEDFINKMRSQLSSRMQTMKTQAKEG